MIYLFLILPFVFLLVSSYFFNRVKKEAIANFNLTTLADAVISYLIVFIIFLFPYVYRFYYLVIAVILLLAVSLLQYFKQPIDDPDVDLKIETKKNNLVLFTLTYISFVVFMTIFRFQSAGIQILLALVSTSVLFVLSILIRKLLRPVYEAVSLEYRLSNNTKYIAIFIFIVLFVSFLLVFQIPTNSLAEKLNLNNNIGVLKLDGTPADANNNFTREKLDSIVSDEMKRVDKEVIYSDEQYIYIAAVLSDNVDNSIVDNTYLIIYDKTIDEVVKTQNLGPTYTNNYITSEFDNQEIYKKYVDYNGDLLLFLNNGIYKVHWTTVTLVRGHTFSNARYFFLDNKLMIVIPENNRFNLYEYDSGVLNDYNDSFLDSLNYDDMEVISNNLFYRIGDVMYLYENPDIHYAIDDNTTCMIFDKDTLDFYYVSHDDKHTTYHLEEGALVGSDFSITSTEYTLWGNHNDKGLLINDKLYFVSNDKIEMLDTDMTNYGYYNIVERQVFSMTRKINSSTISSVTEKDNQLLVYQISTKPYSIEYGNLAYLDVYKLHEQNVGVNLPVYGFYGLFSLIWIGIAFFIPITNYKKDETVIDFDSAIKKKSDE